MATSQVTIARGRERAIEGEVSKGQKRKQDGDGKEEHDRTSRRQEGASE
jgi:hypothetical protein